VTHLDEYSDTLLRNIQRFLEIGDSLGAKTIQSSCIGCLAHLAALCELISWVDPDSKPQMDIICDSSLERLGHLTQSVDFDDTNSWNTHTLICCSGYVMKSIIPDSKRIDNIVNQVSWERSLPTFDSHIWHLSHEQSASLRLRRQVVAEAWSDFKARQPAGSPPALTARSVYIDGREEVSRYPNFMLSSERYTYGI